MVNILSSNNFQRIPPVENYVLNRKNPHRALISIYNSSPSKRLYESFDCTITDQRSFSSLPVECNLYDILNNEDVLFNDEEDDDDELNRTISLPFQNERSIVSSELNWLLSEHSRHHSSINYNDTMRNESSDTKLQMKQNWYTDTSLDYQNFINIVKKNQSQFKKPPQDEHSILLNPDEFIDEEFEETISSIGEFKKLINYSIPLIMTFLLDQSFQFISVIIVGHIGTNELAAISLSIMANNIIFSIFEGMSTALDTLCPQAFGSGDFHTVGIHFQRCTILSLILYIPFGGVWWYSGDILALIISDSKVVTLAGMYQKYTLPSVPAFIVFETLKRFLQAQGIFQAATYVLFISVPFSSIMSYLLVWNFELGFYGSAIACNLNAWLIMTLLILYTSFIEGFRCWGGFSKEALQNWGKLMKLSLPGILIFFTESFLYEIMTLIASNFGTKYLAVQTTASTVTSLLYTIPFSIGIAGSTRIANFIGARKLDSAKKSTKIAIYASVLVGILNYGVVTLFSQDIIEIFTDDLLIIEMAREIFPIVGLTQIMDAVNTVAGGCLRGEGMQRIGSIANVVGYLIIGIPTGWLLSYHFHLKLFGLWYTNGIVLTFIGGLQTWFALDANWEQIQFEADERNRYEN
ncbi:hypothetical protein WICMUC_005181 [Wickerhamomyces mucosus]|uniref:MATE efflux family protein n=1 Tax=Wickerhamomyces mucosus TaxID=1378264 RepID=A0A9P8P966_9ASCO|nr:hypothetical protein WICMUC_005181 [Wickerhamomyces mucosus]